MKSRIFFPVLLVGILLTAAVAGAMTGLFDDTACVIVCPAQKPNNGAATVVYADTAGYKWATLLVTTGISTTTLDVKLQECAASGGSYADITGAAIVQEVSGVGSKAYAIDVPLEGGRLRYLKPVITAGNGSAGIYVQAAILLRGAGYAPLPSPVNGIDQAKRPT